jgi:hypothetical protein
VATTYRIELDDLEIGQPLDGLESRAESWERTANYLRTSKMPDGEFFLIKVCSKPEEADSIAARYRSIIRKVVAQMESG